MPAPSSACGGSRRPFHAGAPARLARQRGSPPGRAAPATVVVPGTMQQRDEQADEAKAVHLNAFLAKIYSTTGWGVLGLLGSAQLLTVSGLAFAMPMPLLGVGLVGGIGSSMAMAKMAPMYTAVPGEGLVAVDSAARKAAYAGLVGSFGCLAAPMFGLVSLSNPTIIPAAAVASIATMSGAALYALNAGMGKEGEAISAWGPALTGGLFGLIGVGVGGMGCSYLGYHEAAAALHSISTYGGVVLFAGLTAYDTRVALEMHAAGQPDHLGAASQLFMNFANLFTRFMAIFYDQD